MAACTTSTYAYYIRFDGGIYYTYYWNKTLHKFGNIQERGSVESGFFPLENGAIIDVKQQQPPYRVIVYTIDYSSPDTNYIRETVLSSDSGDPNNILLQAENNSGTLTVAMYSLVYREVTVLTFNLQTGYTTPISGFPSDGYQPSNGTYVNTPCFLNQQKANGQQILTYCDGFTRHIIASDGDDGVSDTTTVNSEYCGYFNPLDSVDITETKRIRVERCIPSNPVYLKWKNLLGGWDSWLFGKNQKYSLSTETDGSFESSFTNISDITNPKITLGKRGIQTISLGAQGLTIDEVKAISKITVSNKVYIMNADGTVNREVTITPGTFLVYESKNYTASIEFEIEDVELNTLRN